MMSDVSRRYSRVIGTRVKESGNLLAREDWNANQVDYTVTRRSAEVILPYASGGANRHAKHTVRGEYHAGQEDGKAARRKQQA